MTRAKICGLTRARDVALAAELGAWACGFVLTASPRRVRFEEAHALVPLAAPALAIGVFACEEAAEIAAAAVALGLDGVQLSGGGDGPTVAAVRAALGSAGAARTAAQPLIIAAADTPDACDSDLLLFDSREGDRHGGTGRPLDWEELRRQLAARGIGPGRIVLAGGLDAQNVVRAIEILDPFAVDVASGVEKRPGIKDEGTLESFFAAVRDRAAHHASSDGGKR